MTSSSSRTESDAAEILRIRAEQLRRAREVPAGFYGWARPVNQFFHYRICQTAIAALVRANLFPLDGRAIADIGCGAGSWLLEFAQWGADPAQMAGIDLDEGRIVRARRRLPSADLRSGDAHHLPWPDSSFDVVSQFTMFTSILSSPMKVRTAAEMMRVLKPGGAILWYDFRFNSPGNPNVRGIEDAEIRSLFPGCGVTLQKITLAPPLARRLVPISWTAASLLEKAPFLRTHYFGIIHKSIGQDRA
jgi:ubiquinone/menaquinone biosynthesis C-methylase UbiE